jgi:hypothetical protein
MRTFTLLSSLFALTLTLASGCDEAASDFASDEAIAFRPFSCTWCTTFGNGPIVNNSSLSWIVPGGTTPSGLKVQHVQVGMKQYTLGVNTETERFTGRDLNNPADRVDGAALVGAKIVLELMNSGGAQVLLTITDYDDSVASWSDTGAPVTAYRASYSTFSNKGSQTSPLCPSASPENQWFVLIAGERYDSATNAAIPDPSGVTIACVGEAAAKMKMLDYHPRGERGASLGQRQSTLYMLTADYCGSGTSNTISGKHVAWENADGTAPPPYDATDLEAIWGPSGALCINKPRHVSLDEVLDQCAIPLCDDDSIPPGAEWRTSLAE